jgi:hypothetical protein
MCEKEVDLKKFCDTPKLKGLRQLIIRKQLISEKEMLMLEGQNLLAFYRENDNDDNVVYERRKTSEDAFDRWWKAYPGTDTFTHKNKSFSGGRSLRTKKDECKEKLEKILSEGEYTISELIAALEFEVLQKKEKSVLTKSNALTFMQNSLTYLNQKTYESFVELIREGNKITITDEIEGSTDI